MPMPPYEVLCTGGCGRPAVYKVAARWSDGITQELKTYALSCADCLRQQYASACRKQAACRLTAGESLAVPAIFELLRGQRDQQLPRRGDLEEQLRNTDE